MSIAERYEPAPEGGYPVTAEAARWLAALSREDIPASALERASHVLLDWFGCTIAGQSEPAAELLSEEIGVSGDGPCTLIAAGKRAGRLDAAVINGTAAHALDYDDVNRRLHGHPTACIAPALMALAEETGSSGAEVLTAFIAGTELACSLGEMCEEGHYEAGFHASGTMGTFGAAAACAKLMGLDATQSAHALGIAASQASGLKVNFGTMTKPFHAGKAAMNGLLAARLAARGFTASSQAIEGAHGFAQAEVPGFEGGPVRAAADQPWAVEQMLYKYHAACFLTHASLDAIRELRAGHGFKLDDVSAATLTFRSTHLSVCCIPEPVSGLEIKFSIAHLAAMGLDGADTSALETYCDANANDPRFIQARKRIALDPVEGMDRSSATVKVELEDGRTLEASANVGIPAADTAAQWDKLSAKFNSLAVPVIGAERAGKIENMIAGLENEPGVRELMETAG